MPEKKLEFGISFGVMSPKISAQIRKQKFAFKKETVKDFEEQLNAIHTLRFADILLDKMYDKCIERLYKKIRSHVCKQNKLVMPSKINT